MHYLLAILCPPLAVLLCQKPMRSLVNLLLTLFFWIPGVIHALVNVREYQTERKLFRMVGEMQNHRISWALKKI